MGGNLCSILFALKTKRLLYSKFQEFDHIKLNTKFLPALHFMKIINNKKIRKLDVDPRRDDDASSMSSYRCMLRPT